MIRRGKKIRPFSNRIIAKYSKIDDVPVFETDTFEWAAALSRNWEKILTEAQQLLEFREYLPPLQSISPDHGRLAVGQQWKAFFLHGYGHKMARNCARCPQTARLVEQIPGLQTAMFSILAPGAHITRHRGPTNAFVTAHLALKVPREREKCTIYVDDRPYHWEQGELLIFDDSRFHEVRNDTDEERVILLMHIMRPVGFPGSLMQTLFMGGIKLSPFVIDAKRNEIAWERKFQRLDTPR